MGPGGEEGGGEDPGDPGPAGPGPEDGRGHTPQRPGPQHHNSHWGQGDTSSLTTSIGGDQGGNVFILTGTNYQPLCFSKRKINDFLKWQGGV